MNVPDLRREIFSYLRKEPKLKCSECNNVLIWDKKINRRYVCKHSQKNHYQYLCLICYYKNVYLNYDFFSVVIIFLTLIYICYYIIHKLI